MKGFCMLLFTRVQGTFSGQLSGFLERLDFEKYIII